MNQDYYLSQQPGGSGGHHHHHHRQYNQHSSSASNQISKQSSSVSPQPKTMKARDGGAKQTGHKDGGKHGKMAASSGNNNSSKGVGSSAAASDASVKGKTQLARDYYMMQAFVQQPHNQMGMPVSSSGQRPESITNSATSTVKRSSQKHHHNNNNKDQQQFVTPSDGTKKTSSMVPSATYYTTNAHMQKTQGHHHSATSASTKRQSGASSAGGQMHSEPTTGKRTGAQSAHCGTLQGGAGSERTPKTPQTANVFRRKWGGASSTKSHKSSSVSQQSRSATIGQHVFNQQIPHQDSDRMVNNRSARHTEPTPTNQLQSAGTAGSKKKKDRSRPNSSSKTPKQEMMTGMPSSKAVTNNNYKTLNQAGYHFKSTNAFAVMETPPITTQKGIRSNSSEIKTNHIDFTALARNRMQTQSTKKNGALAANSSQQPSAQTGKTHQQSQHHIAINQHQMAATSSPFQEHAAGQPIVAASHQMPPKPMPSSSAKNIRRKSKSKSISQQANAVGSQMQCASQKNIQTAKPIMDRNGVPLHGTQSQQMILSQDSVQTKKKLRSLLHSATLTSGDGNYLKPGDSAIGQQVTPSRKSDSNAKLREENHGVPISNRRISHQSGHKNTVGKGKHGHHHSGLATATNIGKDRNQVMTPVMSQTSHNAGKQSSHHHSQQDHHHHHHQNTRAEKQQTKSHRIPAEDTQRMNHNNPLIHNGYKSRHRSASNQKHQASHHPSQMLQTQGYVGQEKAVKEPSQTDQKRRESGGKRKKSSTRRGKSAKRTVGSGLNNQGANASGGNAASQPVFHTVQHHGYDRGRSPHRNATIQSNQLTTTQGSQSNQMLYSAYRLRTLRPKNGNKQQKQHESSQHHGGSVSLERNEIHHVGLLNKAEVTQQLLMQSASSGHSTSSHQGTTGGKVAGSTTGKEQKAMSKATLAQKQKMISNIQQQVIQGSKAPTTKRAKNHQDAVKKQAQQTEKKQQRQADKEQNQIKVDLMKASIIADIRIDTRMQRQSQENTTPSSSMKSGKRTNEKKDKQRAGVMIKPRSVSSDEHLSQNVVQATDSGTDDNQKKGNGSNSPKFLLSLRQLEKLLFSSQKISTSLKKGTNLKGGLASRTKKQLIQNSLKQLSLQENNNTVPPSSKQQAQQSKAKGVTEQQLDHSPSDQQFITIQPASMQVFSNTLMNERNSTDYRLTIGHQDMMTPFDHSQSHTQSVAQLATDTGEKQVQLRMSGDQDDYDPNHHAKTANIAQMKQQLLQATARKIQDKISRQSSNLLSLVDLQKMRAQRMATTYNKKTDQQELAAAQPQQLMTAANRANAAAKQIYKEYSNQGIAKTSQKQQQLSSTPQDLDHVNDNSAQRLQNLIYAKLESRQTPKERKEATLNSAPAQPMKQAKMLKQLAPEIHDEPRRDDVDSPNEIRVEYRSSSSRIVEDDAESKNHHHQLNEHDQEAVEEQKEGVYGQQQSNDHDKFIEKEDIDPNSINNAHENSFLDRVQAQEKSGAKVVIHQTQPDELLSSSKLGQNTLIANDVDEKDDASMCSLKQPSLRQITSSHTSRSNKLLQRQESADQIRRSQDPNASITLSRILLETSMQQSERGNGGSNKIAISAGNQYQQQCQQQNSISDARASTNQQRALDAQAQYSGGGGQPHKFQRFNSDMTVPESGNNDIMSYQSINLAKGVLSEAANNKDNNDQIVDGNDPKQEVTSDMLRSMPRSLTYPEKLGGEEGQAMDGSGDRKNTMNQRSSQKTPLQNFMADEVWPTNSSHRKRKSSITSLSNSTPGSRTLEQLQHQSHTQSLQSPSSYMVLNNNGVNNSNHPITSSFPGGAIIGSPSHKPGTPKVELTGKAGGRTSQMIFDEELLEQQRHKSDKDLIERSPLQYQRDIQASLMESQMDQQLVVQDQGQPEQENTEPDESVSDAGESVASYTHEAAPSAQDHHQLDDNENKRDGENTPSTKKNRTDQQEGMADFDDEAIMSRGTTSPKRRRSPSNPVPSPTQGNTGYLKPIQLDNSTSFINDDFDEVGSVASDPRRANNQDHYQQLEQPEQTQVGQASSSGQPAGNDGAFYTAKGNQAVHNRSRSEGGQAQNANIEESSSYEDIAPYEKSQNEGLNLILFQGAANSNNFSRDHEEQQEEDGQVANQDDIEVQLEDNNDNDALEPQLQPQTEADKVDSVELKVATEKTTEKNPTAVAPIVIPPIIQQKMFGRQFSTDTDQTGRNLTAIEDVLILTPQSPTDGEMSPSPKMTIGSNLAPNTTLDKSRSSPKTDLKQENLHSKESDTFGEACGSLDEGGSKILSQDQPSSRSSLGLEMIKPSQIAMTRSEKQTPSKIVPVIAGPTVNADAQSNTKLSEPTVGRKQEQSEGDMFSHDHIKFTVEKVNEPSVQLRGSSIASSDVLDFEEAVNVELSPSVCTNNTSPTKSTPTLQGKTVLGTGVIGTPSILGKKSPLRPPVAAQGKLFDIDSLNEINKANDLASKKIEITNYIFDSLVSEIKENLFPLRDEEEECYEDGTGLNLAANSATASTGKKKKKKKRKVARTVKRPSVQPKIKEIKDGQPVDMCLNRIMTQASKMRRSLGATASPEMTASLSLTQSLSASKEDLELFGASSYIEHAKSKEQLEASTQFHQLEMRKQEQCDLMQKQLQAHEDSKTTSQREEDDLKQLQNNLRGIKTSTDVVDQYLSCLFDTLLSGEQEFLDNLATPFSLNPLQELIDVQVLANQASNDVQLKASQPRKMLSIGAASTTQASQDNDLELALFGQAQQQHPVLSVEIYLEIERKKEYVLLADSISEINMSADESQSQGGDEGINSPPKPGKKKLVENQSMLAEWENIHNKVLFDAVNDALDEFRPYGLKGPPAPWSGQTRALTYRYSQNAKEVLQQVQDKVVSLSKTFGGALANSELLREYHIRGPLEQDKLQMLREERLAIMMMQDVEETQHKWEDLERQETGIKIELADLILEQLTKELVDDMALIGQRKFDE